MTKAIRYHEAGGPDVLRLEDVELPPPAQGQLRLRQTAVAVNFRDILIRRGGHSPPPLPSARWTPVSRRRGRRCSGACP